MVNIKELRKGRTPEDCMYYDRCAAPICPLDELYKQYEWIQEEEVCINPEFQKLIFIKQQRIIHNKRTYVEGTFTVEQLREQYKQKNR
jgi:hypothetical protein